MVLLWNALLTLRFCWATREFTLVWSEIIFEILSNLGAGILPDTDLFGPVWKNMSGGEIYYSGGGRRKPRDTDSPQRRRDAETSAEKQRPGRTKEARARRRKSDLRSDGQGRA